jgi:hypothetical protein
MANKPNCDAVYSFIVPNNHLSGRAMLTNASSKGASSSRKRRSAKSPEQTGKYSVPVVRSTFRVLEELAHSHWD